MERHCRFYLPSLIALIVFFVSACSTKPPEFETTMASFSRAELTGRAGEALVFYQLQAEKLEQKASMNPSGQLWALAAQNYEYASRAARSRGDLQKAALFAGRALNAAEKTGTPIRAIDALYQLIQVNNQIRNSDQSLQYLQRASELIKDNRGARDRWQGFLDVQWAIVFMRMRKYPEAIEAYRTAITWNRNRLTKPGASDRDQTSARMEIIDNLGRLGDAHRMAGQLEPALQAYIEAFDALNTWQLKYPHEHQLYAGVGNVYREQKQLPKALDNFKKALALAAARKLSSGIVSASARTGAVLLEMGKPADALPFFTQATAHIESVRSRLQAPDDRQSFFERGVGLYLQSIRAQIALKQWSEAFNLSERARARAFLDVLGTKTQLSRTPTGLIEEERTLGERIAGLKARLAAYEEEDVPEPLRTELAAAEKTYSDFLTTLGNENKEQQSLLTVKPLNAKQIQELLDPETSLISYLQTGEFVRIWIVEKKQLRYVQVRISRKEIADLVKRFREAISAPEHPGSFNELSQKLHEHLLAPVLPHVKGKELVIVPHDVLHYLPFHALVSPDGKFLIERYPISYLPSASLLQFTREKRSAYLEEVLAFGNPDLGDRTRDLEFAEMEVKEVKAVYPKAMVFVRREATEEKSKSLMSQHTLIHFATHAELKEDDPLSSAVLLAKAGKEDGRLQVNEIFGMNLKANLVVLSGCDTALGKLSTGDELVGLTRAFIYAGTPTVVASLWQVDDAATALLMSRFYENLKTMSKVEALRQAQLRQIKEQRTSEFIARRVNQVGEEPASRYSQDSVRTGSSLATSHPYFWAPFILVGEGR